MCSRLIVKLSTETRETTPGGPVPYQPANGGGVTLVGQWGTYFGRRLVGFARVETFRQAWLSRGWEPCRVPVIDFAEGHGIVTWAGQAGADLGALYRSGEVVIITRQASAREQALLRHHRVPMQVMEGRLVLAGGPDWLHNPEKQ